MMGVTDMQPHQQRVVEERNQLADRLNKLSVFLESTIFKTLPLDEQRRLSLQCIVMNSYLGILDERITAFGRGSWLAVGFTSDGGYERHVVPMGDTAAHSESKQCVCLPTLYDGIWVHHAADGREYSETDMDPKLQKRMA